MKTLVAALALFSMILAGCSAPERHVSMDPKSAIVPPNKLHPVTLAMEKKAAERAAKPAPEFRVLDEMGREHSLGSLTNGKPLMMFFINKECPCCVTAEPEVRRLYDAYSKGVNFVGVIDGSQAEAKDWAKKNEPKYPLLLDPDRTFIASYGAIAGVYMIVVSKDRAIDKVYPGYSKDSLRELSERLARQSGVPAKAIDFSNAPDKLTTGCAF